MLSNILRAELYRLVHSWQAGAYLCAYFLLVLYATMSSSLAANHRAVPEDSFVAVVRSADLSVACGVVVMLAGLAASLFLVRYCLMATGSGFIKSMLQARRARLAYAGAVLVLVVGVSCLTVLVGVAAVGLGFLFSPATLSCASPGGFLAWLVDAVLVVVLVVGAAMVVGFATWNYVAAMAFVLLVPSGMVWSWVKPALGDSVAGRVGECLLSTNAMALMEGGVPGVTWTLIALAAFAIMGVLLAVLLWRRNLA